MIAGLLGRLDRIRRQSHPHDSFADYGLLWKRRGDHLRFVGLAIVAKVTRGAKRGVWTWVANPCMCRSIFLIPNSSKVLLFKYLDQLVESAFVDEPRDNPIDEINVFGENHRFFTG